MTSVYIYLLEIEHDSGIIDTRYEFGDDLYAQVKSGEAQFFLYDGLGSTRSLTDESGVIQESYNYTPFGESIGTPSGSTNHLFTGEYYDSNLKYYYLRARYYSPGMGRFTGYDPVEDANNKLHKHGVWLVKAEEVAMCRTAEQFRIRLGVKYPPKYVTVVEVPTGTWMRTGGIAKQEQFGKMIDEGIQYELLRGIPERYYGETYKVLY